MSRLITCGFECGIFSSGGYGEGHAGGVLGNVSFSTTTKRSGNRSLRINPSAGSASINVYIATSAPLRSVGRVYVYFATLPNASTPIIRGTVNGPAVYFNAADSKIYAAVGATLGATGVSVTTGQWYRIDWHFLVSTLGNDTCDAKVNGTALGQASDTGSNAGRIYVELGNTTNATADFYFDDLAICNDAADYPIAAGKIEPYVSTSDGTHNIAGTGDFRKGSTGADILNSTTDAYTMVNDVPLPTSTSATNAIFAIAPANPTTDYVQLKIGPAAGFSLTNPPQALGVIAAHNQAATQSGSWRLDANDNGSTSTVLNFSGAGVTAMRYLSAEINDPPSAASVWDIAGDGGDGDFANFAFNFLGTDAAPDQILQALMVEAEFADGAPVVQLSGSANGAGTASGGLKVIKPLSGSITGAGTASGTLEHVRRLSGSASGAGTASGSLSVVKKLSGTTSGAGIASGTVKQIVKLSGSASGTSNVTGTIVVTRTQLLSGTANGSGVASGGLTVVKKLSGVGNGTGVTSGSLSVIKKLSGAADGSGVASGTISVARRFYGTINGDGVASGGLAVTKKLSGTITGVATVTGALASAVQLSGTANGTSSASGSLSVVKKLSGNISGDSTTSGTLSITRTLSGSITGAGQVSGSLSVVKKLSGVASGTGTCSGQLTVASDNQKLLSGVASGAGTISGGLSVTKRLTGVATGSGVASGGLSVTKRLSGSISGSSVSSGVLAVARRLSGAADGNAVVSGSLTIRKALSGVASGESTSSGGLSVVKKLSGSISGDGTITGDLKKYQLLSGIITGTGVISGTLLRIVKLSGTINGGSIVTGAFLTADVLEIETDDLGDSDIDEARPDDGRSWIE